MRIVFTRPLHTYYADIHVGLALFWLDVCRHVVKNYAGKDGQQYNTSSVSPPPGPSVLVTWQSQTWVTTWTVTIRPTYSHKVVGGHPPWLQGQPSVRSEFILSYTVALPLFILRTTAIRSSWIDAAVQCKVLDRSVQSASVITVCIRIQSLFVKEKLRIFLAAGKLLFISNKPSWLMTGLTAKVLRPTSCLKVKPFL